MWPVSPEELAALVVGTSFAAGLNVYATLATLGLLGNLGLLILPERLNVLQNPWIILAALALFGLEFFADKIPIFDLVWNALHTFIRVPLAALVAYGAAEKLSLPQQLLCALLGALVAFAAHGGKLAARAAVTHSPEPLSNISLSVSEDVLAVFLVWYATRHPYLAAAVAIAMLFAIALLVRAVFRALGALFRRLGRAFSLSPSPGAER